MKLDDNKPEPEKSELDLWLDAHDPDILFPIERCRQFVQSVMADSWSNPIVTDAEGGDADTTDTKQD